MKEQSLCANEIKGKSLDEQRSRAKAAEFAAIRRRKLKMTMLSVISIIGILALWQIIVSLQLVSTRFLASPIEIVQKIVEKLSVAKPDGSLLFEHILASLEVVWIGFLLGAFFGIIVGLVMGWYKTGNRILRPLFEILRPIPGLAWIPIVIVFLGVSTLARGVIIFFGAFVSIVLNTYTGIRSTNETLKNVAKTCGASDFEVFVKVGIPSAMPMIFAGLRTSMGMSWGTIVAAEMLGSSIGLGFLIQYARSFADVALIMSGILVLGICGQLSSMIVQAVEGIVLKWRPKINEK
jgi:taurine transport system permease protein